MLITVHDASNIFNVSEQTVRSKIQSNKIPKKDTVVKSALVPRTPLPGNYYARREVSAYSFADLQAVLT